MAKVSNYTIRDLSLGARGGNLFISPVPANQPAIAYQFNNNQIEFTSIGTYVELPIPQQTRGRVVQVSCRVAPTVSHVSLPPHMPRVRLRAYDLTGAAVVDQTQIDTSASTGAYEIPHFIVLTVASQAAVFSATTMLITIDNENFGDSLPLLNIDLVVAVVTPERTT